MSWRERLKNTIERFIKPALKVPQEDFVLAAVTELNSP